MHVGNLKKSHFISEEFLIFPARSFPRNNLTQIRNHSSPPIFRLRIINKIMAKEGLTELLEGFVHATIELDFFIKATEDIGNFLLGF